MAFTRLSSSLLRTRKHCEFIHVPIVFAHSFRSLKQDNIYRQYLLVSMTMTLQLPSSSTLPVKSKRFQKVFLQIWLLIPLCYGYSQDNSLSLQIQKRMIFLASYSKKIQRFPWFRDSHCSLNFARSSYFLLCLCHATHDAAYVLQCFRRSNTAVIAQLGERKTEDLKVSGHGCNDLQTCSFSFLVAYL